MAEVVRAAGVVMLRPGSRGPKVLLVHRPRRKDWSLPKGKLDRGEHVVTAAVRECDEETGIVPILGMPLGRQSYQAMGRPKTVDYWVATPGKDNGFSPDSEIDEIRWVTAAQARSLLTYKRDFELVKRALELPPTQPMVYLRHAVATKRSDFSGDNDRDRPLTGKGRSQAQALVPLLAAFGVARVHSSDAVRCLQTVKPFAAAAKVTVEQEPLFSEHGYDDRPKASVNRAVTLAEVDAALCICSHRPVLPDIMAPLAAGAGKKAAGAFRSPLPPGGFVVVHRSFTGKGRWRVEAAERQEL